MHWTCLVVTKDDPRDNTSLIENALAPFNEQTTDEAFCERRDITDEAKQDYARSQGGAKPANPQTFEEFIAENYGDEAQIDDKGNVTNLYVISPQWDWYQIGGRWQGMLRAKNPELSGQGEKSQLDNDKTMHGCDVCQKGNVDWAAMETRIREQAAQTWTKARALIKDRPTFLLEHGVVEDLPNDDPRRAAFFTSPIMKELRDTLGLWHLQPIIEILKRDLPDYCDFKAAQNIFRTYAFLDHDGQWHETDGENAHRFDELLAEVPDDYWLTVVDCHS